MWHVSSRIGVATLRTAIHLLLTYLLAPPTLLMGYDTPFTAYRYAYIRVQRALEWRRDVLCRQLEVLL